MSADHQPRTAGPAVWQAASVADELESLFVDATGPRSRPVDLPPSRPRAVTRTLAEARKSRPAIGALMAAGLVGIACGALLVPAHKAGPLAVAPSSAVVAPVTQAVAVSAAPPAELFVAEPVRIVPAPAPAPRLTKATARAAAPSACRHAQCTHSELLAADRRLRKAFSRAVDAGVPRAVLVDYRNRWASLRHDAVYRPNRVATGYGAMAGDLNRLANRRQASRHSS
jgi:hypothetical protein